MGRVSEARQRAQAPFGFLSKTMPSRARVTAQPTPRWPSCRKQQTCRARQQLGSLTRGLPAQRVAAQRLARAVLRVRRNRAPQAALAGREAAPRRAPARKGGAGQGWLKPEEQYSPWHGLLAGSNPHPCPSRPNTATPAQLSPTCAAAPAGLPGRPAAARCRA